MLTWASDLVKKLRWSQSLYLSTWAAQVRQLMALRWFILRLSTQSASKSRLLVSKSIIALFDVYHLPAAMACSLPGINASEMSISNGACKRRSDTRSVQLARSSGERTKRGPLTLAQLKNPSSFRKDRGLKTIPPRQWPMSGK